jgi:hypothetical protein
MKEKCADHTGVPPGHFIGSPPFAAAGVSSIFMRFWPTGYLNSIQKRDKYRFTSKKQILGWACIGLYAPTGTALRVQFYIGDKQSDVIDIYFDDKSTHTCQLWQPPVKETPEFEDGEELVVGCDIFQNLRFKRFTAASEPRLTTLGKGHLTRCLSSAAPTLHIDKGVGRRLAMAPIEIVSTDRYALREKRYHPHASNVLNTTSAALLRSEAEMKQVRALPSYGEEDDSRPGSRSRGRDLLVNNGKAVFSQFELDEKFNEKFGPHITTRTMSSVHNLGSTGPGAVWGPHSDVN